jgi:hypothetical protein
LRGWSTFPEGTDNFRQRKFHRAKAPNSETLGFYLCVFARDIPTFGCGFAALGLRGEVSFQESTTGEPEQPNAII